MTHPDVHETKYALHLRAHPKSPSVARRLARKQLQKWDLGELGDDVSQIVTELVSNAVRHAGGAVVLTLQRDLRLRRLSITVSDSSTLWPVITQATATAESGRGLAIVAALASQLSVRMTPEGKDVAVILEMRAAAPTDQSELSRCPA